MSGIRLRPLERDDLKFVHNLDNDANIMRYWFEEPYEAFVELQELYDKHIHDQTERRFVIEHTSIVGRNSKLSWTRPIRTRVMPRPPRVWPWITLSWHSIFTSCI